MSDEEFLEIDNIEKERLYRYFERIKKQFNHLDPLQIVAKFLIITQSISTPLEEISNILRYYEKILIEGRDLLDFAFEWINAQRIRFKYKKYLSTAQFANYLLAIDDCIFHFFLIYDDYVRRKILKEDVKEFNISMLYEIFFSNDDISNFQKILEWHKINVPTIFYGAQKMTTNLITLRSGLSRIIQKDFNNTILSSTREVQILKEKGFRQNFQANERTFEFNGTMIERFIKFFCFSGKIIIERELENAIKQFLSSYFKFGTFYEYNDFKEKIIQSLAEYINSGLTDVVKKSKSYNLNIIKLQISEFLKEFEKKKQIKETKLDGLAWINDLKNLLKNYLLKFLDETILGKKKLSLKNSY
ncbi:MAG: hypothetical protein ACTSRI_00350 [Promethearchaeota archaeon]